MTCQVDHGKIIEGVTEDVKKITQMRKLRIAVETELEGSYKRLPLFKVIFAKHSY